MATFIRMVSNRSNRQRRDVVFDRGGDGWGGRVFSAVARPAKGWRSRRDFAGGHRLFAPLTTARVGLRRMLASIRDRFSRSGRHAGSGRALREYDRRLFHSKGIAATPGARISNLGRAAVPPRDRRGSGLRPPTRSMSRPRRHYGLPQTWARLWTSLRSTQSLPARTLASCSPIRRSKAGYLRPTR